jgi:NAD+ synthase (glutamine-hydrolysing)
MIADRPFRLKLASRSAAPYNPLGPRPASATMAMLRIALAQLDLTVGDIDGNAAKVRTGLSQARAAAADVVLFPELTLTGYPPEDLLLKPRFVAAAWAALHDLLPHTAGMTAIVGVPERAEDLFNAAAVLHDGRLAGVYRKTLLPNYAVFDEDRYFAPGDRRLLFERPLDGDSVRLGVSVCEDLWYPTGPPAAQAAAGAEVLLAISASPFQSGKTAARERMLATRAADNIAIVAFCNLVGGQDELVFDGGSVIVDERGEVLARARTFEEDFVVADVEVADVVRQRLRDPRRRKSGDRCRGDAPAFETVALVPLGAGTSGVPPIEPCLARPRGQLEEIYAALVLATRDYVHKNGFEKVVLGLSGGVDSALVAAIAVDALGADNVVCVSMPSRYSSEHSRSDATEVARRLGVRLETVAIEPAHAAYLEMLAPVAGDAGGVMEENLQSRARGNVLMALSNRFGWLVLTTGNKSELAVGYATIYGDMAGGFAVIKDVPKGLVYKLCRYRNDLGEVVPERVLAKPPSAELRPGQLDADSLPDYERLDAILAAYVERECSAAEIVALGHDAATVRRVIELVDRNEYKRRQAAPGPKVTGKAFGKDRRLPITSHWRGAATRTARSTSDVGPLATRRRKR